MKKNVAILAALAVAGAGLTLGACEKKADTGKPTTGTGAGAKKDHDHAHGDGHDHDHDHDHDHGAEVKLGETKISVFTVEASINGEVKEGDELHVNVKVSGGTPNAVRAWVGVEDGGGSMKSKGDKEEHGYHMHVEVPKPMQAGAKLWVEIEDSAGVVHSGSFELKK